MGTTAWIHELHGTAVTYLGGHAAKLQLLHVSLDRPSLKKRRNVDDGEGREDGLSENYQKHTRKTNTNAKTMQNGRKRPTRPSKQ